MRKIALVGSTGSIGAQVVNVVRAHPDQFAITALIARASVPLFEEQLWELKPEYAALTDERAAQKVKEIPVNTKFYAGEEAALNCLSECGADVVFVACGGFAGLKYSLRAIEISADLALANKETLVCGGELVMPRVKNLMPVDSEHSAIWQCLNFRRDAKVKDLILTASGGPFRGRKFEELNGVTPGQALAHPTWKMGKKITVDSATLLNKGYEVIEAHHLYGVPYQNIKTVIQPQSIVHSMVGFQDGAILAQMSYPTMELPIQLALTYPQRLACPSLKPMDFAEAFSLEFLPLARREYPLYDLALTCGEEGGILPAVLNAASEVAVHAFLNGRISFTDIYRIADKTVGAAKNCGVESYPQLAEADATARAAANTFINEVK